LLGDDFSVREFTLWQLQDYVDRRVRQRGRRGKPLSTATIRKEVTTLGAAWAWAVQGGKLEGAFPKSGVRYPKVTDQLMRQTWIRMSSRTESRDVRSSEVLGWAIDDLMGGDRGTYRKPTIPDRGAT
jgi:hypothetical protein